MNSLNFPSFDETSNIFVPGEGMDPWCAFNLLLPADDWPCALKPPPAFGSYEHVSNHFDGAHERGGLKDIAPVLWGNADSSNTIDF